MSGLDGAVLVVRERDDKRLVSGGTVAHVHSTDQMPLPLMPAAGVFHFDADKDLAKNSFAD